VIDVVHKTKHLNRFRFGLIWKYESWVECCKITVITVDGRQINHFHLTEYLRWLLKLSGLRWGRYFLMMSCRYCRPSCGSSHHAVSLCQCPVRTEVSACALSQELQIFFHQRIYLNQPFFQRILISHISLWIIDVYMIFIQKFHIYEKYLIRYCIGLSTV
jgi:hypothetical protein